MAEMPLTVIRGVERQGVHRHPILEISLVRLRQDSSANTPQKQPERNGIQTRRTNTSETIRTGKPFTAQQGGTEAVHPENGYERYRTGNPAGLRLPI